MTVEHAGRHHSAPKYPVPGEPSRIVCDRLTIPESTLNCGWRTRIQEGGVPAGTRTRNLLLRRQLLCPIELQGQTGRSTAHAQRNPPAHSPHTGFLRVHSNTSPMPQQVHGTLGSKSGLGRNLVSALEESRESGADCASGGRTSLAGLPPRAQYCRQLSPMVVKPFLSFAP
jgi:hypothetical protein